jgi:hypothetical protein
MMFFIFCLLFGASVNATEESFVCSRNCLHKLKTIEDNKIRTELINNGIKYIDDGVFNAAKKGYTQFTTEPFYGCTYYSDRESELGRVNFDSCEYVIKEIRKLVSQRFPDCKIIFDNKTMRYSLVWD